MVFSTLVHTARAHGNAPTELFSDHCLFCPPCTRSALVYSLVHRGWIYTRIYRKLYIRWFWSWQTSKICLKREEASWKAAIDRVLASRRVLKRIIKFFFLAFIIVKEFREMYIVHVCRAENVSRIVYIRSNFVAKLIIGESIGFITFLSNYPSENFCRFCFIGICIIDIFNFDKH